jgi:hypothetical protein
LTLGRFAYGLDCQDAEWTSIATSLLDVAESSKLKKPVSGFQGEVCSAAWAKTPFGGPECSVIYDELVDAQVQFLTS